MEKREDRERLSKGFGGMGKWVDIMVPKTTENILDPRYVERSGEGLKKRTNPIKDVTGIYEIAIIPKGGTEKDRQIYYLGKAGGEDTKSTLKDRAASYMNNGSHKKIDYDAILKAGGKVQMRYKQVPKSEVVQVEKDYLSQLDYSLNKVENGQKRYEDVIVKKTGYKKTLDKWMPKEDVKKPQKKEQAKPLKKVAPAARTMKKARPPVSEDKEIKSILPKRADGKLDMRVKVNKMAAKGELKLTSDGEPDMRYKENKQIVKDARPSPKPKTAPKPSPVKPENKPSPSRSSQSSSRSTYAPRTYGTYGGYSNVPMTKSGTPDMRYSSNKSRFS